MTEREIALLRAHVDGTLRREDISDAEWDQLSSEVRNILDPGSVEFAPRSSGSPQITAEVWTIWFPDLDRHSTEPVIDQNTPERG